MVHWSAQDWVGLLWNVAGYWIQITYNFCNCDKMHCITKKCNVIWMTSKSKTENENFHRNSQKWQTNVVIFVKILTAINKSNVFTRKGKNFPLGFCWCHRPLTGPIQSFHSAKMIGRQRFTEWLIYVFIRLKKLRALVECSKLAANTFLPAAIVGIFFTWILVKCSLLLLVPTIWPTMLIELKVLNVTCSYYSCYFFIIWWRNPNYV